MRNIGGFVNRYGLIVLFVAVVGVFAAFQPAFRTTVNAFIILQSVVATALVALGLTVSLTVNGFDMAVGSTVSFTVMVAAATQIFLAWPWWLSLIAALLGGVLIGLFSGLLIVLAKVPDMIATLGTMFVFSGLSLILTAGKSVSNGNGYNGTPAKGEFAREFLWIGRGKISGVPFSVIVLVAATVLVVVFLGRTRTGRIMQSIGGNEEAARLAGANTKVYRVLAYMISGFLASLGGVILVARVGRGDVNVGSSYLLEAVAAALVGYTLLGANRANALGSVVGALFIGVVVNGLTMFNVPYYTQDFIKGALLVLALIVSFSTRSHASRARATSDGEQSGRRKAIAA